MLIVTLATIAASGIVVVSLLSVTRSLIRQHARERDLLLNQLLHATGKPWLPAPADDRPEPAAREPRTWTASPEQQPVY